VFQVFVEPFTASMTRPILLRMSDERESVSDKAATILKVMRRLRKGGQAFSRPSQQVLVVVHDRTSTVAREVSSCLKSLRPTFDLAAVQAESKELHDLVWSRRLRQLNRIGPGDPTSPVRVLAELNILNAYERIRAYYLDVAETLAGEINPRRGQRGLGKGSRPDF